MDGSNPKLRTELKKSELIGEPPKIPIDIVEEVQILDLTFSSLESKYKKLKEKLLKNNKLEVDSIVKLRFLLHNFDTLIDNIEEVLDCLDKEGTWKLTDEDIDRINCNKETNDLFKTFLPYMLTYHLMKKS